MRFAAVLGLYALVTLIPFQASAERYVFIGDSLVDNRNSYDLSTPVFGVTIPESPPYYDGRFSNGPNWTDQISPTQALYSNYFLSDPGCDDSTYADTDACGSLSDPGVLPDTSLGFAVGGSKAGSEALGATGGPGMLTVLDDLTDYVNNDRVAGTSNAVFAMLTGGNDYTGYLGAPGSDTPQESVDDTLDKIGQGIDRIAALGAKRIIVLNLFDLGQVPTVASTFTASDATELSSLHNAGLPAVLEAKRQSTGLDIVLVDLGALYDDIFARPAFYGFTNTTGSCIDSTTLADTGECPTDASEDETLFWDGQHPTTAAHAYIAQLVESTLDAVDQGTGDLRTVAETQTIANRTLMEATRGQLAQWHAGGPVGPRAGSRTGTAFASGGTQVASAAGVPSAGFTPMEWRTGKASGVGDGRVFIAGAHRNGDSPAMDGRSGFSFDSNAFLGGVEIQPTESTMVGVHFGVVGADNDVDGGGGSESDSYVIGVHGGWRRDALSLTAQASLAWVDIGEIERATGFALMPMARGETEGWIATAEVEGRYALSLGDDAMMAPLVRLGGSTTRLDSYRETGAGPMNLSVDRTSISEVRGGVGAAAWTLLERSWGVLSPEASFVVERELLHDVGAGGARLSSGQELSPLPDTSERHFATFSASLGFAFDGGVQMDLSVATTYGENGSRMNVLPSIKLSAPF